MWFPLDVCISKFFTIELMKIVKRYFIGWIVSTEGLRRLDKVVPFFVLLVVLGCCNWMVRMLPAHVVREASAGENFTAVADGASSKSVRQRKRFLVDVVNVFNCILYTLISPVAERVRTAAFGTEGGGPVALLSENEESSDPAGSEPGSEGDSG